MRFDFLLGLMAEALLIVIGAKLARDLVLRWRGQDVNDLVVHKRSVGAAVMQVGYLIGVLMGFLGAIGAGRGQQGFLAIAAVVALSGVVAIVLQLVADVVSDKLIFRGLEPAKGTGHDVNVTLAVGKAAVSIATGLVLRGAMSDPDGGLLGRIVWFAAAQAAMVLAVLLYCRLTPYDDMAEVKNNNLAAGFPIAGILLAVGLVMEAGVAGRASASWSHAALETGKFLGVSLVLVYVFRLITDFMMLPKVKLSQAVVADKNVAAGIQEGASFVLASLIVTFFLA
jgi:uncharacterized membrane protein YjfL (UPF0719 family)